MPRESKLTWLPAALTVLCGAGVPQLASAGDVSIALAEDDTGVTVQIRGVDPDTVPQQVVTSKTGALLFVPGDHNVAERIRPRGKHRLGYVQVGRTGTRVAVRLAQAKRASGRIARYLHTHSVPGGIDVRIDDAPPRPVHAVTTPAPTRPTETLAAATASDRQAALDRLASPSISPPSTSTSLAQPLTVAATPIALAAQPPAPAADEGDAFAHAPRRAATAGADEIVADTPAPAPRRAALGLVAALAFGTTLGLGLWWRRRRRTPSQLEGLRVLSRVNIGPKQQILWIQAGDRSLLVGATEHSISLLTEVSAKGAAAAPAISAVETPAPLPSFAETLPTTTAPAPTPAMTGEHRVAAFKQRLRAALGDELAGRAMTDATLPPHLELMTRDPKWAQRKEAA